MDLTSQSHHLEEATQDSYSSSTSDEDLNESVSDFPEDDGSGAFNDLRFGDPESDGDDFGPDGPGEATKTGLGFGENCAIIVTDDWPPKTFRYDYDPLDSWFRGAISALRKAQAIISTSGSTFQDLYRCVNKLRRWLYGRCQEDLGVDSSAEEGAYERALRGYDNLRDDMFYRIIEVTGHWFDNEVVDGCLTCSVDTEVHSKDHNNWNLQATTQVIDLTEKYCRSANAKLWKYGSEAVHELMRPTDAVSRHAQPNRPGRFPFLDLPQEIQDLIIKFCIYGSDVSVQNDFDEKDIFDSVKPLLVSMPDTRVPGRPTMERSAFYDHYIDMTTQTIFQLNRHIRASTLGLLHQIFPLEFLSTKTLCWFLSAIGTQGRSQIRHVILHDVHIFDAYSIGNVSDTFELLSDCKRLDYLEIYVPETTGSEGFHDLHENFAHLEPESSWRKPRARPMIGPCDFPIIEPLKQISGCKDVYIDIEEQRDSDYRGAEIRDKEILLAMVDTLEARWKRPREDTSNAAWRTLVDPADATWSALEKTFKT